MNYQEYLDKRKALEDDIVLLELEYVATKTDLKVGDKIKYYRHKGNKKWEAKHKGVIKGFEIKRSGDVWIVPETNASFINRVELKDIIE